MTSRSRRQTRQRRNDGWPPEQHNEAVRIRKAYIRAAKRWEARRRERARALRHFSQAVNHASEALRTMHVALVSTGQKATALAEQFEIVREQELQRQIAWADRMAAAGFDMREEHEALERGELVD